MNQEIIDSFSLFIAYIVIVPIGFFGKKYFQKKNEQSNKAKDIQVEKNDVENQQQQTSINSPASEIKQQEKQTFYSLFLQYREQFKQNKQSFEIVKIAKFLLYLSNYVMIVSILNNYLGNYDFTQSCWVIGLIIGPIFNLIQQFLFLVAYFLALKISKQTIQVNFDICLLLAGYFYFIIGNLIIVASMDGNGSLIDKAFAVFGIAYIWELIFNFFDEEKRIWFFEKFRKLLTAEKK